MHTLQQLQDGSLSGCTRLQLSCGLREFPPAIFDLADTLEILDLSGNALSALPDDLHRLRKLRVIFCSNNQFTTLPSSLGACRQLTMIGFKSNRIGEVPAAALPPALRWLILTDNRIAALPDAIGGCTQLQKLMLAGNALTDLPASLAACGRLELLRIAANRLSALPPWLLDMPRLAWLAYAGNPFSAADEAAAPSAAIAWDQLAIEQQLGEGASGVIYQASMYQASLPQAGAAGTAVAVKLFKGAITSDGLPDCELAACVSAGAHANLIPVLGEVTGHPDKVRGCAMALIDPAFGNLAGPPSLESCTRDIYADGRRFSLGFVLRLAGGIAAAARHLHQRGIMHGDLYGHNILAMDDGTALLGDFGAASMHAVDGAPADALQRLEVRAFGVLLGELIERCDAGDRLAHLRELQEQCVQSTVAARPLFGDIVERIVASS